MAAFNIRPAISTVNGAIPCCPGGGMDDVVIQAQALTGRKQLPDRITPPRVTSLVLAGVVLGGSVAVAALLATFL